MNVRRWWIDRQNPELMLGLESRILHPGQREHCRGTKLDPKSGHHAMLSWTMIASIHAIANEVRKLQAAGKRVVFTNGCFDLLHSGHIDLLRRARVLGDALVVAINSDASVARMKGANRPIILERERAELLDGFEMVDFVCAFSEDTPLEAILEIRPDVLVKGADWKANIVGQPEVEGRGGKVVALSLVEGYSTTGIVERVVARYGAERARRQENGNSRKTNS